MSSVVDGSTHLGPLAYGHRRYCKFAWHCLVASSDLASLAFAPAVVCLGVGAKSNQDGIREQHLVRIQKSVTKVPSASHSLSATCVVVPTSALSEDDEASVQVGQHSMELRLGRCTDVVRWHGCRTMAPEHSRFGDGDQPCDDPCGGRNFGLVNMQGCCRRHDTSAHLLDADQNESLPDVVAVVEVCLLPQMKVHICVQYEALEDVMAGPSDSENKLGQQNPLLRQNLQVGAQTRTSAMDASLRILSTAAPLRLVHVL